MTTIGGNPLEKTKKGGNKMKNEIRVLSLTIAIVLLLATSVWSQQPSSNNDQQMKDMPGMQMKKGQMQPDKKMSND